MAKKNQRVKVHRVDLSTFLKEELKIDSFWDDVIYPQPKKSRYEEIIEKQKRFIK
jgi:hypothetical protein